MKLHAWPRPVDLESVATVDPIKNDELERAIVGVILEFPSTAPWFAYLTERDFGSHHLRLVWRAIANLVARGDEPGYLLVRAHLRERGDLNEVGDPFLSHIASGNAKLTEGTARGCVAHLKRLTERRTLSCWLHKKIADLRDGVESVAPQTWASELSEMEPAHQTEAASPFRTARDLATESSAELEYLAWPLFVRGGSTELDGRPKVGKSTLIGSAVQAILQGGRFLERPTFYTPVIWLTEERTAAFRETLRRNGLLDREDLLILRHADVARLPWPEIMTLVDRECDRMAAFAVVIDTLGQFTRLDEDRENQAGDAVTVMRPIQALTAKGRAVLVSRHERKSGGDVGESGRGSNQYAGSVDTVLALRRAEGKVRGTIRILHGLSRFDDVPRDLAIELVHSRNLENDVCTNVFRVLGTETAVAVNEARETLLADLPTDGDSAVSIKDFLQAHKSLKKRTVEYAVGALETEGLVNHSGVGKKGDPHRYFQKR